MYKRITRLASHLQKRPYLIELLILAPLAILALVAADMTSVFDRPVSWDHTVHITRIHLLEKHFWEHFSLHGWTNAWFAGGHVGYFYGASPDIFILLFRAITFFTLGLEEVYALAVSLFIVGRCWITYYLARLLLNRAAGILAALFVLADLGWAREGGWFYSIYAGVWTQEFSFLFIAGIIFCLAGIESHGISRRRAAQLSFFVFLAVITHPLNVIVLPLLWVCYIAASFTAARQFFREALAVSCSFSLGLLSAAFWLIPFYIHRQYAHYKVKVHPSGWKFNEMVSKLLEGTLFTRGWALPQVLALLGVVILVVKGKRKHRLCILFALGLLYLASNQLVDFWEIDKHFSLFSNILVRRYVIYLKYFYWAFAAVGIVWSLQITFKQRTTRLLSKESIPFFALLLFFLTPFVWAGSEYIHKKYVFPKGRNLLTHSEIAGEYEGKKALLDWIATSISQDITTDLENSFFRIALLKDKQHFMKDLAFYSPYPVLNTYSTPAINFRYLNGSWAEVLKPEKTSHLVKILNIRFLVAQKEDPHIEHFNAQKVGEFGPYHLYESNDWEPSFHTNLIGAGDIKVSHFSDQEIRFTAAPGSTGRITLGISYFPNWKAWRNGKEIPIGRYTLPELAPYKTNFMTVPLMEGEYELKFVRPATEKIASLVSILGLLFICYLAAFRGKGATEQKA